MSADSSDVDAAIIAMLNGDATLSALMTDGVFYDIAPHGSQDFVIVSQLAHEEEYIFNGSAWEKFTYLVKAVQLGAAGANTKAAAARIHGLMQFSLPSITGYAAMHVQRIERIRIVEVAEDSDERWQHRGGHYEVMVQADPAGAAAHYSSWIQGDWIQ